jgi:mRNA-degrading endonuclease toxin of MazEF toxin-antitoxin module
MQGELRWAGPADRRRPVLVVQSDLFDPAPTVVVLPVILKEPKAPWPFNVAVTPGSAGLDTPAWIRLTQPRTVGRDELSTPIGTLPADALREVLNGLALILNIASDITPPAART